MHRAVRGRRPACEGSGSYSARVILAGADQADAEPVAGWESLTTAARFNAAEQWHAADATYAEAELMTVCGAACPEAWRQPGRLPRVPWKQRGGWRHMAG
jgi:hypothetical protein